jgi:hypothetical protein
MTLFLIINCQICIFIENYFFSCDSVWFLNGTQAISKYNETAKNVVNLYFVVYRYKQFGTDFLVTFYDPINIKYESFIDKIYRSY